MVATLRALLADAAATDGDRSLVATAHEGENSLLISGQEARVQQVLPLIAQLDVEPKR